jgi:type IV pilus assembly protein PilV
MTMRAISSRRTARPLAARRRMDGVVLIEVMIALLIFMFGVLGMVGLQASVTRATSDSKFRADASYLADDMVGRMWSDVSNVAGYDSTNCSGTAQCNEWLSKVAAGLPGGVGSVTVTTVDATAKIYDATISINWTVPGGQTHSFSTHTTISRVTAPTP